MMARDLTDEHIGMVFWVPVGTERWERIQFEGLTRSPQEAEAVLNGGDPYWMILMCSKTHPAGQLMWFQTPSGTVFSGLMVRSTAEVIPVEISWAVTENGEILELGETAA